MVGFGMSLDELEENRWIRRGFSGSDGFRLYSNCDTKKMMGMYLMDVSFNWEKCFRKQDVWGLISVFFQ